MTEKNINEKLEKTTIIQINGRGDLAIKIPNLVAKSLGISKNDSFFMDIDINKLANNEFNFIKKNSR